MSDQPMRAVSYHGVITDTDRWQNFRHREDDIFICTPAKCGTTWTQAICAMLVFGEADHGYKPGAVSPWIDADFAPIDEYLRTIDEQTHRRFIKTHTPLDGIPFYPECTYLVILRDPRDVFFSGLNHRDNLVDPETAAVFPQEPNPFGDWLTRKFDPSACDQQSIEQLAHFLNSYWPYRNLSNLHMFHYTDMKNDLPGVVARMAQALGYAYDDDQIQAFAAEAGFETMKNNADQFTPEAGTGMWQAEDRFFANGGSGQWQGRLSADELAAFGRRVDALLPDDAARWLLRDI
jgi:hypothetical protein